MHRHTFALGGRPIQTPEMVATLTNYATTHRLHSWKWLTASHARVIPNCESNPASITSRYRNTDTAIIRGVGEGDGVQAPTAAKGSNMYIPQAFWKEGSPHRRGLPVTLRDLGYTVVPRWRHTVVEVDEELRTFLANKLPVRPFSANGLVMVSGEPRWVSLSAEDHCEALLALEARGRILSDVANAVFADELVLSRLIGSDILAHAKDTSTKAPDEVLNTPIRLFNGQESSSPFILDLHLQHYDCAHNDEPLPASLASSLGHVLKIGPYSSTSWIREQEARDVATQGLKLKTGEEPHSVQYMETRELINLAAFSPESRAILTKRMPEVRRMSNQRQFRLYNRWHTSSMLPKAKAPLVDQWITDHDWQFYRKMMIRPVPGIPESDWKIKLSLPTAVKLYNVEQFEQVAANTASGEPVEQRTAEALA